MCTFFIFLKSRSINYLCRARFAHVNTSRRVLQAQHADSVRVCVYVWVCVCVGVCVSPWGPRSSLPASLFYSSLTVTAKSRITSEPHVSELPSFKTLSPPEKSLKSRPETDRFQLITLRSITQMVLLQTCQQHWHASLSYMDIKSRGGKKKKRNSCTKNPPKYSYNNNFPCVCVQSWLNCKQWQACMIFFLLFLKFITRLGKKLKFPFLNRGRWSI